MSRNHLKRILAFGVVVAFASFGPRETFAQRWFNPDEEEPLPDDGIVLPYDQSGSRVFFCVGPTSQRRTFTDSM